MSDTDLFSDEQIYDFFFFFYYSLDFISQMDSVTWVLGQTTLNEQNKKDLGTLFPFNYHNSCWSCYQVTRLRCQEFTKWTKAQKYIEAIQRHSVTNTITSIPLPTLVLENRFITQFTGLSQRQTSVNHVISCNLL